MCNSKFCSTYDHNEKIFICNYYEEKWCKKCSIKKRNCPICEESLSDEILKIIQSDGEYKMCNYCCEQMEEYLDFIDSIEFQDL